MSKAKSFIDKIWYGTGAIGLDLSYGMFYSFLNKYLTDVLKLKANFLLILTPIARIWDGINDPMMGTIVDNTHTRMGKYRPWILRGALMNAVVLALLFNNPGIPASGPWIYVYIAVLYIGWGMTNTLADIPYWSMKGELVKAWDTRSFSVISLIAAAGLIFFACLSVFKTRETVFTEAKEKFSFKKIVNIAKQNDQLRVFMLFAMISNAGFYMISGVGVYFFDVCVGDASRQGLFNTFGAAGSILGLLVIPIGLKFTTRRRTYQFSLGLAAFGFIGMLLGAKVFDSLLVLNVFNLLAQIGTAAMFVSQTVFLADIVDYGEVKMGFRAESVTFSMKGFLQKMAYTLQTVILYAGMLISGYDESLHGANSAGVKASFDLMMLVIPALFMLLSLLIFTTRFKLHGKYMEDITAKVNAARERRLAESGGEAAQ